MKDDLRKNNTGRGIYIALAICMLAIVCVGVYSALSNVFAPSPAPVRPAPGTTAAPRSTRAPATTAAAPASAAATVPAPSGTLAVKPEKDGGDLSVSVVDVPVKRTYVVPVEGKALKGYSDDVLVYSVTMNDYRVHNGVDLAASPGSAVKSFTDGVVEKIYEDPLMGNTVVVDHGSGLKSVYQNLSGTLPEGLKEGSTLKAGDLVGAVGDTALVECAQEAHLHFELTRDGQPVDPADYLELN